MSLIDVLPQPRPVTLAGRVYMVRERRLIDLAYFESLALAMRPPRPSPSEPGIDPAERRRRLRAAFDEAEKGDDLPSWGSPEVTAAVLGTPIGRTEYLRRMVVGGHSPDQLADLDGRMAESDWVALLEATGPREALARADRAILEEIGAAAFVAEARAACAAESGSLREALAGVCKDLGKAPSELADWTVSQLIFVLSGGAAATVDHDAPQSVTRQEWDSNVMIPLQEFWAEAESAPDSP